MSTAYEDLQAQPGFQDADPKTQAELIARARARALSARARLNARPAVGLDVPLPLHPEEGPLPSTPMPTPAPNPTPGFDPNSAENFFAPGITAAVKAAAEEIGKSRIIPQFKNPDAAVLEAQAGLAPPDTTYGDVAALAQRSVIPPPSDLQNAVMRPSPLDYGSSEAMRAVTKPFLAGVNAAGASATPQNAALAALFEIPGVKEAIGPILQPMVALDAGKAAGQGYKEGGVGGVAKAGAEMAGGMAPFMLPGGQAIAEHGRKPVKAGLSVESIDTPGKLLPRSREEMFKVGAAVLNKYGEVDTPTFAKLMETEITPNVPDGWKIARHGEKNIVLTPEVVHAGAKAQKAKLDKLARSGVAGRGLTPDDVIQKRTDYGVEHGGKEWYSGDMGELVDRVGEDAARRLSKTESIVSPDQKVEQAVGQTLDKEEEVNYGAPPKKFGRYATMAGAQYANDITPSGPKVEPYDHGKQLGIDDAIRSRGEEPKTPAGEEPPFAAIDTIHTQGSGFSNIDTGKTKMVGGKEQKLYQSVTNKIRAYTDAQLRMEARRIGAKRVSHGQAANWVGTQHDLMGVEGGKVTPWARLVLDELNAREAEGRQVIPPKGESTDFDFGANAKVGLGIEHVTPEATARAARDTETPGIEGFTLTRDGKKLESGYSYAPDKSTEFKLNRPIRGADIAAYAKQHEALLSKEGHNVGGWKDGNDRYLDVSVHEKDLQAALDGARAADQKAIYDHAQGKSIPLEGVGSLVVLKDGRVLTSDFVPHARSRQLPTHLSVIEKAGVDPRDVAKTGWIIDGKIDEGGGGSIDDIPVTSAEYEAERDGKPYVPYAQRPKVGLQIERVDDLFHGSRKNDPLDIFRPNPKRGMVYFSTHEEGARSGASSGDSGATGGEKNTAVSVLKNKGLKIFGVGDSAPDTMTAKEAIEYVKQFDDRGEPQVRGMGNLLDAAFANRYPIIRHPDGSWTSARLDWNDGEPRIGTGRFPTSSAEEYASPDAKIEFRKPLAIDWNTLEYKSSGSGKRTVQNALRELGYDGILVSDEGGHWTERDKLNQGSVAVFPEAMHKLEVTKNDTRPGYATKFPNRELRENYDAIQRAPENANTPDSKWPKPIRTGATIPPSETFSPSDAKKTVRTLGGKMMTPEEYAATYPETQAKPAGAKALGNEPMTVDEALDAHAAYVGDSSSPGNLHEANYLATKSAQKHYGFLKLDNEGWAKYEKLSLGEKLEFIKAKGLDETDKLAAELSPIEKVLVNPSAKYKLATQLNKAKFGLGIEHVDTPEGEAKSDRVGRANLARFGLVEDQKKFIRERGAEFEKQRTITFDELRKKAESMGLTLADTKAARDILMKNRGTWVAAADVAETLRSQRETAYKAWQDVQAAGTPREIEIAARKLDKATEAALVGLKASVDIGSELGRGLVSQKIAAMKIPAYRYQKALGELIERLKDKSGDGELPADVTTMLRSVDMSDPASIRRFILSQSPKIASWNDKFYEFWISMLLSNPTTHFRNTLGNTAATAGMPFESLGAALAGSVLPGERQTKYGEAPAQLYGMVHGFRGAWEGFKAGIKGSDFEDASKIEHSADPLSRAPKIAGTKGKIIRLPLNALQAADNASKAIVVSASIHQQAYAQAASEGLHGKALLDRAREIADLPDEKVLEKAHSEAEYRAFQRQLGKWGKKALSMRATTLGEPGTKLGDMNIRPLAYVAPFMTTPVNLLKYGAERTPLEWLAVAKRGLSGEYKTPEGRRRAENDISKAVIGSVVAAAVWQAVASGSMTGSGPTSPSERKALTDAGWAPYTIKVGGKRIPYNNVDPASTAMMIVADTAEIWNAASPEERKKLVGMIGRAYGNNIQDKTFLSGVTGAMNAIDDPDRYLEQYTSQQAASMAVPAIVGGVARATDPYEREARGIVDTIKARVPGLREQLMPKRDIRGKPVPARGTGVGEGVANEAFRFGSPALPAAKRGGRMERLVASMGESVPAVPKTVSVDFPTGNGKELRRYKLDLTPEEYDVYQQYRGRLIDMQFKKYEGAKEHPFWSEPEQDQRKAVKQMVSTAGEIAQVEMLSYLAKNKRLPEKYADALAKEAAQRRRSFAVSIKE